MTPTPSPPAEAVPVAWRWIGEGDTDWTFGNYRHRSPFVYIEPLYSDATIRTLTTAREQAEALLSDLNAVHANMLRATIAKPSIEQIEHLYPEIREAREQAERERDEVHNARIRDVTEATRQRDEAVRDHAWAEQRAEILNRKYNQWFERCQASDLARQAAEARATALEEALRPLARLPLGAEVIGDADLVIYKNAGRAITVGDILTARGVIAKIMQEEIDKNNLRNNALDGNMPSEEITP